MFKFRLLDSDNKVVGFEAESGGYWSYSGNNFAWNGIAINHSYKELSTNYHNKDGEEIFQNDIVKHFEEKYTVRYGEIELITKEMVMYGFYLEQNGIPIRPFTETIAEDCEIRN